MSANHNTTLPRRFNLIIALAICFLATACAQKPWMRDDTTQADFDKDKRECAFEAEKAAAPYQEWQYTTAYNRVGIACLKSRGYTR